jgi:hypothetical protein
MNLLELRKKFLAVLLVSFMALGMAACSSTDDPASDDSASGGSSEQDVDCSTRATQQAQDECEWAQEQAGE